MNIGEFFEQQVQKNPEKVYLYFQDQEVTYRTLDQKSNQIPMDFWNRGFEKEIRWLSCSQTALNFSISGLVLPRLEP